jgi:hypothetical protein
LWCSKLFTVGFKKTLPHTTHHIGQLTKTFGKTFNVGGLGAFKAIDSSSRQTAHETRYVSSLKQTSFKDAKPRVVSRIANHLQNF